MGDRSLELRTRFALMLMIATPLSGCDERQGLKCQTQACLCDSGEAIPEEWVCDGVDDCRRGQDEQGCPLPDSYAFRGSMSVDWAFYDPILERVIYPPGTRPATLVVQTQPHSNAVAVSGLTCSFRAAPDPSAALTPEQQAAGCVAYAIDFDSVDCLATTAFYSVYTDGVSSAWARWCGDEFEYMIVTESTIHIDDSLIYYYFRGARDA